MNVIRVLVADDHPVFRFGLRALLATEPGMEVVGEATTGDEAIALADELTPDVVLMDLNMPGLHGIEATQRITSRHPHTSVLVITMIDDDSVFAAMRAGARGYILKGDQGEETLGAIRAVARGEAIFSASPASRLLEHFATPSRPPHPFPELSGREREILTLMAGGYTNDAIANRLFLSQKTVRNYVSSIFAKLEVNDRPTAIIRARAAGLATDNR
jgi:DNA-binding NarL/FixJ family response regulator